MTATEVVQHGEAKAQAALTLQEFTGWLVQDHPHYSVTDQTVYGGWAVTPDRQTKVEVSYASTSKPTIVAFLKCSGEYVRAVQPYSDTAWREVAPVIEIAMRHGVTVE